MIGEQRRNSGEHRDDGGRDRHDTLALAKLLVSLACSVDRLSCIEISHGCLLSREERNVPRNVDVMTKMTRQEALKSLVLPALAAAVVATTGIADAKSSKSQLKYQDHPKGSAKCSECKLFLPGKTAKAAGSCKVVAGSISPNGWCLAFTKK